MCLDNTRVMTSPIGQDLKLTLFKGLEGISKLGVSTYEGVMTFKELADHTQVEANSDTLCETLKKQRDVDKKRVNGLKEYWQQDGGQVIPNITIFTNNLDVMQKLKVGNRDMIIARLSSLADRFICDGQGRTTSIKDLMQHETFNEYQSHTISFKLIVTHTENLSTPTADKIIKQVFADYHVKLIKPNKSISNHFSSKTPLDHLLHELKELDIPGNKKLKERLGLHGKVNKGTLWKFDQFRTMVLKFLGATQATANKDLADETVFKISLNQLSKFITELINFLPVEKLDSEDFQAVHDEVMFTKVIFTSGVALVGRSITDEMINGRNTPWSILSQISVPLDSKKDKYWSNNKVTFVDEGKVKIIKGTEKKIGSLICQQLRVYPCEDLMA